jgi:TolB-like protein/DNA-binding winged helix-turn-helix (wHTH) protein
MATCYRFEDIQVDLKSFRLFRGGRAIPVEPKALTLLIFLVENRGRLVRKHELMQAVWNDAFVTEQVLSRAIGQLRKVLDDDAREPRYIETVPTLGFRFIAEVESDPSDATEPPAERNLGALVGQAVLPEPASTVVNVMASGASDSQNRGHTSQAEFGAVVLGRVGNGTRKRAPTVGVLPFVNLSADPENEFFADGITQDVIAHLAKIKALKVISRSSMMTFKNSNCCLSEIGERLGAAALVEGSVRRAGNRVRIVAQLVDVATDEHLWAETYDRELTDIFAIQTDVALHIAEALRAELTRDERARMVRWPTDDLEAYMLYMQGRHSFYRFADEGFRSSLIASSAAVARDPNFALAWTSIAEAHTELSVGGADTGAPDEAIRLAKAALSRALEIDEELGEAHSVAGLIRCVFDFDWEGAERELLRAIELCPGSAEAHDYYGRLCASLQRYDDALREVRCAKELNPLVVKSDLAATLLRAGHNKEALEEAQRMVKTDPTEARCHSTLGWALIFNGEPAAGVASIVHATVLAPGATLFLAQLGEAFAMTGNITRAREILEQLRDRATRDFVSPYHLAYIYSGLGEADAAIDCLEDSFERRSGATYGIKGSFLFANLQRHPRFETLLRRMNLA